MASAQVTELIVRVLSFALRELFIHLVSGSAAQRIHCMCPQSLLHAQFCTHKLRSLMDDSVPINAFSPGLYIHAIAHDHQQTSCFSSEKAQFDANSVDCNRLAEKN